MARRLLGDGTRPCLTVAGVQVYAYVEITDLLDGPKLVVSIHYDTAGRSHAVTEVASDGDVLGWTGKPGIPTEVRIGEGLEVVLDESGAISTHSEP